MNNTIHLQNFGRNLEMRPAAYYEPRNEREVLEILDKHRGEQLRAIGSLHSWSAAAECLGVIISLRHFGHVDVETIGDASWAVVGAGCQIKSVLKQLSRLGKTLPSMGLITEQTIAGAISTGTHGSGRHSLSHYVDAVRVARYDLVTGKAVVEVVDSGDELLAARCSLGCLGIILSVRIRCRDPYNIEEHLQEYSTLDPVLEAEKEFPLQQFYLVPWRWTFMGQHRREVSSPRSTLASLYRVYWFTFIDIGMHLLILFAVRLVARFGFVRFLFRYVIQEAVIRGWKVTDEASAMLVMEHELFRHIETELFVKSEQLPQALEYVRKVLTVAGDGSEKPGGVSSELGSPADEVVRLESLRGQYCHHYPICVRRVLADDTLISMASGKDQVWYAISLISYARPTERQGFRNVLAFLAETMAAKFGARPHWGKWCPLTPQQLIALYPRFAEFREICESKDPQGVFRNNWFSSLFAERQKQ